MTKQEAINWIKERAGPQGLEKEVMWYFEDACESRNQGDDYSRAAWEAMYEWDC